MSTKPSITLARVDYYGATHIGLQFTKNQELLADLRVVLPEIRWSASLQLWHIPWREDIVSFMFKHFKGRCFIDYSAFRAPVAAIHRAKTRLEKPAHQLPVLDQYRVKLVDQYKTYLQSKRYSENTIKTYSDALGVFFRYFSDKQIDEASRIKNKHKETHHLALFAT